MMEEVRERLCKQVREGDSPKDMLEARRSEGPRANLERSVQVPV